MKSFSVVAVAACALLSAGSASGALVTWNVRVLNAPAGANDIHLIFSGTGGFITNRAAVFPAATGFPGGQPGNR